MLVRNKDAKPGTGMVRNSLRDDYSDQDSK
jgi:hypothetical protein